MGPTNVNKDLFCYNPVLNFSRNALPARKDARLSTAIQGYVVCVECGSQDGQLTGDIAIVQYTLAHTPSCFPIIGFVTRPPLLHLLATK